MNYVNKYKGRKYQCVDRFRKDLKKHMKDNKTRLTSKSFGLYSLYKGSRFDEVVTHIHEYNTSYTGGVSEDGRMSMNTIYPILVDKLGYFKLMVFDVLSGTFLYNTKSRSRGLLTTKDESTCLPLVLSC